MKNAPINRARRNRPPSVKVEFGVMGVVLGLGAGLVAGLAAELALSRPSRLVMTAGIIVGGVIGAVLEAVRYLWRLHVRTKETAAREPLRHFPKP